MRRFNAYGSQWKSCTVIPPDNTRSIDFEGSQCRISTVRLSNVYKLYKTMDILNSRNFNLNSLGIQTSTIGNIKTLSTFAEKHCINLEKLSLTALQLPPKGLHLFFRNDFQITVCLLSTVMSVQNARCNSKLKLIKVQI